MTEILFSTQMDDKNGHEIINLLTNQNPKTTDVMKGISLVLDKILSLREDFNQLNKRLDSHDNDIFEIKINATKTNNELDKIHGEINELKQQQIEDEVILIGFQHSLSVDEERHIFENLIQIYKLEATSISRYYSYSTKGRNMRSIMVVKFCDKRHQIDFIGKIIKHGSPTLLQLLGTSNNRQNDYKISCSKRLTTTNIEINKVLRLLKKNKYIYEIRFRNRCYEYKKTKDSTFSVIKTIEQLHMIKSLLNVPSK